MILEIGLLILGFVLLIKSAEYLIDGSSSLALRFNVSQMAIGLTIVAFGTSAPELIVNVIASFAGRHAIAFGNVLGSNIFNTLMVLGVAGCVHSIAIQRNTVLKEIPFLLISTIFTFALAHYFGLNTHMLTRFDGFILIVLLIIFFIYVLHIAKQGNNVGDFEIKESGITKSIFLILIGIGGLFLGGELVVDNAVKIARFLGVSDKLIGLTIVALGTSLPELFTSIVAVRKKNYDLAVGNVIGSNLYNLLLVLGLSSIISPLEYDVALNYDFFFLIGITLVLFFTMFTGKKHKLDRWEAAIFVLMYIGYMGFIIKRG